MQRGTSVSALWLCKSLHKRCRRAYGTIDSDIIVADLARAPYGNQLQCH